MKLWVTNRSDSVAPGEHGSPVGPSAVQVGARRLHLPDGVCASFAVTGYPAQVAAGWLDPLLGHPGQVEVTLHIEPVPAEVAAHRLRRRMSRLEADRRSAFEHGRLSDPQVEAAVEDAAELAARLARAQGRLFRVGLYLTVHAADEAELEAAVTSVRAVAASLLLDVQPATFRQLQGWVSCLPLGRDLLGLRRTFDTDATAACFPFASPDLTSELSGTSVLYGVNLASAGPVIWDRFAQENYNSVILARSGAGKSYLAKLETLRSLINGVEAAVIDPEDEYAQLAETVGGAYVHLGDPGVRLNPFDLPADAADRPDALTRRALFLHTLVSVLAGEALEPRSRAALDRAIVASYQRAGITADPRTWRRPAPLLADLAQALGGDADPAAGELVAQLAPYVTGTHRGLFDGPTSTRPDSHLIVFSLRDLPEELRPAGHLLALDQVWQRVTNPADLRPRLVVVDEAWLLMQSREGGRFLHRLAKSARKYWVGLTVVTQDGDDLLGSELGRAIVANAATQILLRQAPQAIDRIAEMFHLSAGEAAFLSSAATGEGLLAVGRQRVPFKAVASEHDHQTITSDPAERAQARLTATPPAPAAAPPAADCDPAMGLRVVRGEP
jgi:type IV secretory pathway VirB4 component